MCLANRGLYLEPNLQLFSLSHVVYVKMLASCPTFQLLCLFKLRQIIVERLYAPWGLYNNAQANCRTFYRLQIDILNIEEGKM
jgi:hypothetical protein